MVQSRKKKIFNTVVVLTYLIPFMWILLCSDINYTFSFSNPDKGALYVILDIATHIIACIFGGGVLFAIGFVISLIEFRAVYGDEFDSGDNEKVVYESVDLQIKLSYILTFILLFMEYSTFATIKFT